VLGANWGSTIEKNCRMAFDRWNPENLDRKWKPT
jgi:hypothetical protein